MSSDQTANDLESTQYNWGGLVRFVLSLIATLFLLAWLFGRTLVAQLDFGSLGEPLGGNRPAILVLTHEVRGKAQDAPPVVITVTRSGKSEHHYSPLAVGQSQPGNVTITALGGAAISYNSGLQLTVEPHDELGWVEDGLSCSGPVELDPWRRLGFTDQPTNGEITVRCTVWSRRVDQSD